MNQLATKFNSGKWMRSTYSLLANNKLIIVIFLSAFLIKSFNASGNYIITYDQSRDLTRVWEMLARGDIKLVGPETDIPGVFNGVIYYYFVAFVLFLGGFNLNILVFAFVMINSLICVVLYKVSKDIFGSKSLGLIASTLWAISYEQANYARYISNASMMIPTSILFFVGLMYFVIKRKNWGLVVSAIGYGLSIHSNFYLIYLVLFYPILYALRRPRLNAKAVLLSLLAFFIIVSPFLAAEIRWEFTGSKNLTAYIAHQAKGGDSKGKSIFELYSKKVIGGASTYLDRQNAILKYSYVEVNRTFAVLILLASLVTLASSKQMRQAKFFLLIWAFSTLPLFYFSSGVITSNVINSTILFPLTLIYAYVICSLQNSHRYLFKIFAIVIFVAITYNNFAHFYRNNFINVTTFLMNPILQKDLKRVVDYTYMSSEGEAFSVCAVTTPLFINTTWSMGYKLYGESQYGFLPYWVGHPAHTNANFLPAQHRDIDVEYKYLIIEPSIGMQWYTQNLSIYLENQKTRLIEEKVFNNVKVQKRVQRIGSDPSTLKSKVFENLNKIDGRYHCDQYID